MAWYAVYVTATGDAVSFTSTEPDTLPAGLAYVAVDHQPDAGETWDPATRSIITYTPVPADPAGGLYELPTWRWWYAIGSFLLPASAPGNRSAKPTDAAAKAYIRANANQGDVQAAVLYAASRRDALGAALTAAGVTPSSSEAYTEADAALAFLGACLV